MKFTTAFLSSAITLLLSAAAGLHAAAPDAPDPGARAYVIDSANQFPAGRLADAYLGDYVLENKLIRAVIARPDKPEMGEVRGGSLIDIVLKSKPVDYFASLNTSADPLTTSANVVYKSAVPASPTSAHSSATLTLRGQVGQNSSNTSGTDHLAVETVYHLGPDSPVLRVDSTFTNPTSRTAWIHPADIIDWGEAGVFTEKSGFLPTTSPAAFVLGAIDDSAVGYFTSGTAAMEGYHSGRDSVILAKGAIQDLAREMSIRKVILDNPQDNELPYEYRGMGATKTPQEGMVVLPGTESRYIMSGGFPTHEALYVPEELVKVIDGKATVTTLLKDTFNPFTPPSTEKGNYIEVAAGGKFTFTRYLVPTNSNWDSIATAAYKEKQKPLHELAGLIIEQGTDQPIADAYVQISGGPAWDGTGSAPPVLQTKTASDGSFIARLPEGTYRIHPAAIGRFVPVSKDTITLKPGTKNELKVIRMSAQSRLRLAISEAETATSSPLPAKLTLISKPPFPTINYGFSADVSKGERNTIYMPHGIAVVPVTPGRYRLVVSRGIEYDIFQKDITIAPGQELSMSASLRHVMKGAIDDMVSMDAGLVTDASTMGYVTAESRAVQAACEGVDVIVSGDYGKATDLQSAIEKQGLERWVKAFTGRRELLHKGFMSADLLVYPLDDKTAPAFDKAVEESKDLPPDVALADLREKFPNLIIELSRPTHPEAGYLNSFKFDVRKKQFEEGNVPPPDFNAIQMVEGGKIGVEQEVYPQYMALQLARLSNSEVNKGAPLSPVASSFSRLPYGQEVGYPRTYLYMKRKGIRVQDLTGEDIASAVRGQHLMVTNGPILLFDAMDISQREFRINPGEIVDSSTTEIVRIRARVLAAPWVNLQGINTRENGVRGITVFNILPTENILRYPTNQSGSHIYTRYLSEDTVLDAYAFSTLKSLAPVVTDALPDFGGPVFPLSWSGPIFVDRDGDGKIITKQKQP